MPNRPENVELQRQLLELPVVPLGVFPGGTFRDTSGGLQQVETTIHFGATSPEIAEQIVAVECAIDYERTALQGLVYTLRDEWARLTK
jgi:hypothetical protein